MANNGSACRADHKFKTHSIRDNKLVIVSSYSGEIQNDYKCRTQFSEHRQALFLILMDNTILYLEETPKIPINGRLDALQADTET